MYSFKAEKDGEIDVIIKNVKTKKIVFKGSFKVKKGERYSKDFKAGRGVMNWKD